MEIEIIRCDCKVHKGAGVEALAGKGLARLAAAPGKAGATVRHNLVISVAMGLHRTASGAASGPWPIGTHGPAA